MSRIRTTIAESHPHLVAEWDFERNLTLDPPLTPDMVSTGSGKEAWWVCNTHGPYLQTVQHRTKHLTGCPKCAGRLGTTLAESHPHLVAEWDFERNLALEQPLTPDMVSTGSDKSVWWKCDRHGPYLQKVGQKTKRGYGCIKCRGSLGTTLAESHPHLVDEWDFERNLTLDPPLTPDTVATGSNKKVWWICQVHGPHLQGIQHRLEGHGCGKCAGRLGTTLAESHPHLVAEWDFERNLAMDPPLTPETVATGSGNRVGWVCKRCGHRWLARVRCRSMRGTGCRECHLRSRRSSSPKKAFDATGRKGSSRKSPRRTTRGGSPFDIGPRRPNPKRRKNPNLARFMIISDMTAELERLLIKYKGVARAEDILGHLLRTVNGLPSDPTQKDLDTFCGDLLITEYDLYNNIFRPASWTQWSPSVTDVAPFTFKMSRYAFGERDIAAFNRLTIALIESFIQEHKQDDSKVNRVVLQYVKLASESISQIPPDSWLIPTARNVAKLNYDLVHSGHVDFRRIAELKWQYLDRQGRNVGTTPMIPATPHGLTEQWDGGALTRAPNSGEVTKALNKLSKLVEPVRYWYPMALYALLQGKGETYYFDDGMRI